MPATDTAERVTLYYREASSDKVYTASVEPSGDGFVVNFAFGRRGSTLQTGTKTAKPVDHAAARKIYDKLIGEKTANGYTPGEDGTPYQHTDKEQRATGILPQLLNDIDQAGAEKLISDDQWWMQEKFDGKRVLIRRSGHEITGINRKGLSIGLPEPITQQASQLGGDAWVIDGESIGDVFHAFDMLESADEDLRPRPYSQRLDALHKMLTPGGRQPIRSIAAAVGAKQKRAMLEELRGRKAEGVVFKRHDAHYAPGRPASGGSQRKLKFYSTASCIVSGVNKGKRSVALELCDGDKRVAVGNVTIPAGKTIPAAAEVIEVRYLYAYPGGSLFQPVFLNRRDDLVAAECKVGQLKYRAGSEDDEA